MKPTPLEDYEEEMGHLKRVQPERRVTEEPPMQDVRIVEDKKTVKVGMVGFIA